MFFPTDLFFLFLSIYPCVQFWVSFNLFSVPSFLSRISHRFHFHQKQKQKKKGISLRIPILASVPFFPNQLHFPLWFAWHRLDSPPESRVMRSCSDVLTSALNAFTCMALPLPWQPPKHPELALYPRFGRRNLAWSHEKGKENVLTIFEIVGVFRPSLSSGNWEIPKFILFFSYSLPHARFLRVFTQNGIINVHKTHLEQFIPDCL